MRDVRKRVRGEALGVRRSATVVGLLIISILLPVLAACAGDLALGDPRQMTFKLVEFTPPEPDQHDCDYANRQLARSGREDRSGFVDRFYHADRRGRRSVG